MSHVSTEFVVCLVHIMIHRTISTQSICHSCSFITAKIVQKWECISLEKWRKWNTKWVNVQTKTDNWSHSLLLYGPKCFRRKNWNNPSTVKLLIDYLVNGELFIKLYYLLLGLHYIVAINFVKVLFHLWFLRYEKIWSFDYFSI